MMHVVHESLGTNKETEITLPVKTGLILVKNKTLGSIKVSLGEKDFTNNYVEIDLGEKEELCQCVTSSACPSNFFDKVYIKSLLAGEVEIRCLKV